MVKLIQPHFASGLVIRGFGRGSKSLGIPTANYGPEVVNNLPQEIQTGVYFGWAQVNHNEVYKMVMSIGWNPYFKNERKSMETHVLHHFDDDFYDQNLRVCILGYLRPELNFNSLDDLISAIKKDINDAEEELENPNLKEYKNNDFFKSK